MKKITVMLMTAIMVLALVGCNANDVKVSNKDDSNVIANAEETVVSTESTTVQPEEVTTESNKKDADWWISMGVTVDDDKKSDEKTTEDKKPATTEATTESNKKPSNTKPSTEASKPATTEATKPSTTEAPKHVHTWSTRTVTDQEAWDEQVCTKEAYDEKVLVKDAWDEQVPEYEYKDGVRYYCVKCNTERSEQGVCPACGWDGCWCETCREQVLVGYTTVHHDAEYKTVHHDAEYTTKHHDAVTHTETYCSECGATK